MTHSGREIRLAAEVEAGRVASVRKGNEKLFLSLSLFPCGGILPQAKPPLELRVTLGELILSDPTSFIGRGMSIKG